MRHAKGLKAVARLPMAEAKRRFDGVGIEGGLISRQILGVETLW